MQVCQYCKREVANEIKKCPHCHIDLSSNAQVEVRIPRTIKEHVGDSPRQSNVVVFRPLVRPPMAVLCILDDGSRDGERIRIRKSETVIGRSEADIIIPHDEQLSGRHASLTRRLIEGVYLWYLRDLQSTNGTFVRVSSAPLRHGQAILLGNQRFRFEAGGRIESVEAEAPTEPAVTRGWKSVSKHELERVYPGLVELNDDGDGKRVSLKEQLHRIGSDSTQVDITLDDPMLSPLHATVRREENEKWFIEDCKSQNGTWIAIEEISIEREAQFQLGEQRFLVKVFP